MHVIIAAIFLHILRGVNAEGIKAKTPASNGVQRITLVELTGRRSNEFNGDVEK